MKKTKVNNQLLIVKSQKQKHSLGKVLLSIVVGFFYFLWKLFWLDWFKKANYDGKFFAFVYFIFNLGISIGCVGTTIGGLTGLTYYGINFFSDGLDAYELFNLVAPFVLMFFITLVGLVGWIVSLLVLRSE